MTYNILLCLTLLLLGPPFCPLNQEGFHPRSPSERGFTCWAAITRDRNCSRVSGMHAVLGCCEVLPWYCSRWENVSSSACSAMEVVTPAQAHTSFNSWWVGASLPRVGQALDPPAAPEIYIFPKWYNPVFKSQRPCDLSLHMRCSSLLESTLLLLPKKRNPCSLYSRAEFRRETVSTPFCYTLLKKGFFRKNKLDTASVWLENTLIAINHSSKLIFTKGFAQGILNVWTILFL